MPSDRRLPPDAQPYDPANGFHVGAFAGALTGGALVPVLGPGVAWVVFVGAAVGGASGYLYERRRLQEWRRTH